MTEWEFRVDCRNVELKAAEVSGRAMQVRFTLISRSELEGR
jgi:hypothetical protein